MRRTPTVFQKVLFIKDLSSRRARAFFLLKSARKPPINKQYGAFYRPNIKEDVMALKWKEQYSTGVWWQDKQHRELFDRLGMLLAGWSIAIREDISELFNFLESYAIRHFSSEEASMEKSGYSGRRAHSGEHRKFLQELAALKAEFEDAAPLALIIKVQRQLVDWFLNHIGNMDKSLGAFIRAQEAKHEAVVNC
jgi:hemerythrin